MLKGHISFVKAIVFLPDTSQLASASNDGTVQLWDAVTGTSLQILESHYGSVNAIAFLPDGKQLASASWNCTVRLWDAATGFTLQLFKGGMAGVSAVAFSSDRSSLQRNRGSIRIRPFISINIPDQSILTTDIFVKHQWIAPVGGQFQLAASRISINCHGNS